MPARRTTKVPTRKSGIVSGVNKGHIVTPRAPRPRPSRSKGKLGERVKLVRSVVREVAGFAPYEKRIMDILKGGGNNPTKRAMRFARGRLGSHQRAKKKITSMEEVNQAIAKAELAKAAEAKATKAAAAANQ